MLYFSNAVGRLPSHHIGYTRKHGYKIYTMSMRMLPSYRRNCFLVIPVNDGMTDSQVSEIFKLEEERLNYWWIFPVLFRHLIINICSSLGFYHSNYASIWKKDYLWNSFYLWVFRILIFQLSPSLSLFWNFPLKAYSSL